MRAAQKWTRPGTKQNHRQTLPDLKAALPAQSNSMRRKKPRSHAFHTRLRVTCTYTDTFKLVGRARGKERTGHGIQPPLPHDLRSVSRAHRHALSVFLRFSPALFPIWQAPTSSCWPVGLPINRSCSSFPLLLSKQRVVLLLFDYVTFWHVFVAVECNSPRRFVLRALQNWQRFVMGLLSCQGRTL